MKIYHIKLVLGLLVMLLFITSCKKYLDAKSDQHLSTPDTLDDLQALLDNQYIYRYGVIQSQTLSDEYYVPFTSWQSRVDLEKLGYIWDPNIDDNPDWTQQYSLVLIANTVLDRVGEIASESSNVYADEIKGSALFLRANCFQQLAQLFAPQYDPATAGEDLGIVLRLDPDFNVPSRRATVQQTYDQIIADLQQAIPLLPTTTISKTRPNKAAGYALLAKIYLQIGDYQKAKSNAEHSLSLYSDLMDFNDPTEVNPASNTIPIIKRGILNKEIIYYQNDEGSLTGSPTARIDSFLYDSYDINDIRKTAFFRKNNGENTYRFKGSLSGAVGWFTGLGTAEVYLIRAECNARLGNIADAMQDINTLLLKRFKPGKAPVFNPTTQDQALTIVLSERKKEMIFRGVRWADLKRLNKNPLTAVTIKRNLDGAIYTLSPNDLRYTLLIPRSVMQMANLEQNPR